MARNKIIYSINIEDVQNVAREDLGRELTDPELGLVEDNIGDQFDWYGAILAVLNEYVVKHEQSDPA